MVLGMNEWNQSIGDRLFVCFTLLLLCLKILRFSCYNCSALAGIGNRREGGRQSTSRSFVRSFVRLKQLIDVCVCVCACVLLIPPPTKVRDAVARPSFRFGSCQVFFGGLLATSF